MALTALAPQLHPTVAVACMCFAGTIAAQRNGEGVVGVIPGPAELYIVRVFNNSGDVNQGQGLVYGSTVILAFTQCEGRLAALQVRRGIRKLLRHAAAARCL
jgi:hypothetical protein